MTAQTFDETQHPRGDGGKFTTKPASEANTALDLYGSNDACDTCGGSLAEERSPNIKASCVFCTGEADYDFPALDGDSLDTEAKIAALADAAISGDVDVRWAHAHAINLDDELGAEAGEAKFEAALQDAGTDWDTLLARDFVSPEDDAVWANNPAASQEQQRVARLHGELESLDQQVRTERTVAAAEEVVAKVESMADLRLPVLERRAGVMTMFSGDATLAREARNQLIFGRGNQQ